MSQHDHVISDADGATFLADLNAMAGAIATLNSGASAPTTTYAYMLWPDTVNDLLKQRNAANSDWINICKLSTWALPSVQKLTATLGTVGGTATAITATQAPATSGAKVVDLVITSGNSGAATTLAVNGDAAKGVKAYNSSGSKVDTTLVAGQYCRFIDDGTHWVLANPLPAASGSYLTGQVVQVVSVTKTDTWSTSSTSMTDVTGMSVAITPRKNTNKILAILSIALNSQSTVGAHAQLLRGATAIGIGDAASARTRATISVTGNAAYVSGSATANVLDSPATASAVTYKVQAMTGQGVTTAYVNRSQNDSDSADTGRGISTLTLLEIDA